MRFLIVLALIKCAAAYSVIDPSNHKTVSVPIGNGMNVDIDVTVDVNTGADDKKCVQGWETPCKTTSECCDWGSTIEPWGPLTCRETSYGKRCVTDEKCYLRGKRCWPMLFNCCPGMRCTSGPDDPPQLNMCIGHGDDGIDCVPVGGKCSPSEHCCDSLWCDVDDVVTSTGTCGTKNKCNANEGEYCTKDEDCCEKDNACESETGSTRPTCTYKPKDCIEDGEPCHGTDDWTHECCSKSCCEGKCGTCGYTPWYKRS